MNLASTEPLEQFFLVALELLCIADTKGHFLKLNHAWESVLGYALPELEGQSFISLVHPGDRQQTISAIATLSEQKPVIDFVNRYKHKNGTYRSIEWRSTAMGDKIFAVARDITDRLDAETERNKLLAAFDAKNRELQRFAYTISHDLKTPLITIQGFAKEVQESLVDGNVAEARDHLDRIQRSALRMGEMLQGILRLAKLGKPTNPFAMVSLQEVVNQCIETTDGLLKLHNVQIKTSGTLPIVLGDFSSLQELFQNLLENAIKYRSNKSPQIEIGVKESPTTWEIFVQDNGIGMSPEHTKGIFELFHQLDHRSDGTGIGLAIVARIAELHNGSVRVESPGKDQGSTFWLSLPKLA